MRRRQADLAQQFDVHVNQITQWRSQLLDGAAGVFHHGKAEAAAPAIDLKSLHAKIGELTLKMINGMARPFLLPHFEAADTMEDARDPKDSF